MSMPTNRASTETMGAGRTGKSQAPARTAARRPPGSKPKADITREAKAPTAAETKAEPIPITPEERYQLIAEAAYFIAERRGFAPGSEMEDWIQAEAEVAQRLGEIASGQ